MSLINCPVCQKKISDKAVECPHCQFSFNQDQDDIERSRIMKFRSYRDKMYRYKMLTFTAIAIAVIGLVPMLWSYAKALDYGFNVKFTNHWGMYLVYAGFAIYIIVRVLMYFSKRNYNSKK